MSQLIIIAIVIMAVLFGPIATIWSANTLFNLSIEYTFYNWLATLILCAAVSGGRK